MMIHWHPFFNIPWGHNFVLLDKLKSFEERLWYAQKIIEHGWSRSILTIWIENNLYRREGKAITNFKTTLPAPQSDLAQQTIKDPYVFDFLTLHKEHLEKDLEDGLVNHIQKFLIELGTGICIYGSTVSADCKRADILHRFAFLSCQTSLLCRCRAKSKSFQARRCGSVEFLLVCCG